MDSTQLTIMLSSMLVFAVLGFGMSKAIKKHEEKQRSLKKKKGKNRYMPEYKKPGR